MPIQLRISQSHPALLPLLVALLLPLLIAALSCDSANSKPSTAAPAIPGDSADFWDACQELEQAIDAWLERQERQERQAEDDYLDGADLLRTAARYDRDEREAETMKRELRKNCDVKWRQAFPKGHPLYDPRYDPSSPEYNPPQ